MNRNRRQCLRQNSKRMKFTQKMSNKIIAQ